MTEDSSWADDTVENVGGEVNGSENVDGKVERVGIEVEEVDE